MTALLSLEALERHPGRSIAAIGFAFALAYVAALSIFPRDHKRIVDGDTIQYYAYLRSMAIDGDLDFTNDYQLLYGSQPGVDNIWLISRTPVGRATNVMSIGPALLWAPFFLVACALVGLSHLAGGGVPIDGIAAPFPLSVGVAGVAYATAGVYLCFRASALVVPERPAFWAAITAWLATSAVYYSVISPAYSHATSLFACALFVFVWLKFREGTSIWRYLMLGVLAGLAALIRWQDGIILLLPAIETLAAVFRRRLSVASALVRLVIAGAAAFAMLSPQFLAWKAIYGQFFLMPQGNGFMRWTSPAIVSVLFSMRHGLFSWTPAVLAAAVGLVYLLRRDWLVAVSVWVVVSLSVYINASVMDWWAGEAFGARRFVGYAVFFALGLSALFARPFWKHRPVLLRWTAAALVLYNLLFLLQYQLFMRGYRELAPYPETARQVLLDRLVLPWVLIRHWFGA